MATKAERKRFQDILAGLLPLVPEDHKPKCREIMHLAYRHFQECSPAQALIRPLTPSEKLAVDEHPRLMERLRELDGELKQIRQHLADERSGRLIDRQKAESEINWPHVLTFAIEQLLDLLSHAASHRAGKLIHASLAEKQLNVAEVAFSDGSRVKLNVRTGKLTNTCDFLQGIDLYLKRILVMIGTYRTFGERLSGSPIPIGPDDSHGQFHACVTQAALAHH